VERCAGDARKLHGKIIAPDAKTQVLGHTLVGVHVEEVGAAIEPAQRQQDLCVRRRLRFRADTHVDGQPHRCSLQPTECGNLGGEPITSSIAQPETTAGARVELVGRRIWFGTAA
jgi:hypothetical protein